MKHFEDNKGSAPENILAMHSRRTLSEWESHANEIHAAFEAGNSSCELAQGKK